MAVPRLAIMMPVYDDWSSVRLLVPALERALSNASLTARVLLINDGSTIAVPVDLVPRGLVAIECIEILHLRRNLSHQRAIAVALCHVNRTMEIDALVVMDADGEDRPEDIPRLVREFQRHEGRKIVFAERTRRTEGFIFWLFYVLYRFLHHVLTGRAVRVGNLSILPRSALASLETAPELWSHYAAAVFKLRLKTATIHSSRGHRLVGTSRMNFVSLVIHGLSAISVFGEEVATRLLATMGALIALCLLGMGGVVYIRLFTQLAIPGWATYAIGLLLLLLMQATITATVFVFMVLSLRQSSSFLPARDYVYYVADVTSISPAHE
jgi:polyisoprenyl-phosphate glycosyltransferase